MVLAATEDLILFPSLITLEGKETRKVRLGAAVARGASEKTYRVFIEELPSKEAQPPPGGQVRVLTRLSIPVFLQPPKIAFQGQVTDFKVQDGTASFDIRNIGNSYFSARQIEVIGYEASGRLLFKQQFEGWYILAAGRRHYDVRLSRQDCQTLVRLTVGVQTSVTPLKGEIDVSPGACGP